jgi:carboxylate-amine ligase
MAAAKPSFTVGIEEEYLLVDRNTRDVVSDPPAEIIERCKSHMGDGVVEPELLRSQIEVNTRVCNSIPDARGNLQCLRRIVADTSNEYGLAPIAASTHPFGRWQLQHHTAKERYEMLFRDMRSLATRMLICGMHVHIGIEDNELRITLLNQFRQFLPLILALSTSSPFWESQETGLMSYRLPVFDTFPRTGLPEQYNSYAEYREQVELLVKAGIINDATLIWWDLRISDRYPTLETRIADMCTDIDDAISLAALTQCLLHYLYRLHSNPGHWQVYPRFLVDQNRWRAIRYGIDAGLIDLSNAEIMPVASVLQDLVDQLKDDAEELGCVKELEHTLRIPERGTSAHHQLKVYRDTIGHGGSHDEALGAVVDYLIETTLVGFDQDPIEKHCGQTNV